MSFIRGGDNKDGLASGSNVSGSTSCHKDAFLGKGTKVVGALSFAGSAEIDGYIEGELLAQGRLTIGESAVVNAKISGSEVVIRGTVNGDITASSRLYLQKPAKVVGNVKCASLGIEEGVAFEGKCTMESGSSSAAAAPARTSTNEKPAVNKNLP